MHGNPISKRFAIKPYCRTRVTKFENRSAIKCRFVMYVTEIKTGCWEMICGLLCTQVPNTSQPNPLSLHPTSYYKSLCSDHSSLFFRSQGAVQGSRSNVSANLSRHWLPVFSIRNHEKIPDKLGGRKIMLHSDLGVAIQIDK